MKRLYIFFFIILAVVSCHKSDVIVTDPTRAVSDGKLADSLQQTTLIYFTGTSLRNPYFNTNVADAKVAVANGALGSGGRFLYLLPSSSSAAALYELTEVDGKCVTTKIHNYSFNTLRSSSVTKVINDVKSHVKYNGDKMIMNMIVSGHGTGWVPKDYPALKSISDDYRSMWEQEGDIMTRFMGSSTDGYMDIEELRVGIRDSYTRFGFMLFDECFMSSIELLYRLRNCSEYIVASPCEVMAAGFPYKYVLPNIFTDDGYNFDMVEVCKSYHYYYTHIATFKYGCVAMCVTSELEKLAETMSHMIFEDVDADELQTYENMPDNIFYDLGQFVNEACTNDVNLVDFNEQFDYTFPKVARLHTPQYYTKLTGSGVQNIKYYSGVTTSDPSVKFRANWAIEPWVVATGRDISVE